MEQKKEVRPTVDATAFIDAAKHYVSESVVQACSEIIGRAFGGDALQTVTSCLSTIDVSSVIIADDAGTTFFASVYIHTYPQKPLPPPPPYIGGWVGVCVWFDVRVCEICVLSDDFLQGQGNTHRKILSA